MVTHDLRGPLISISMSAESIAADTQDPSIRKMAQQMTRSSARMDRLIADLFDVVRIHSGTLRITKQTQCLDALLTEVLSTYEPLFSSRSISFTVDMPAKAIVCAFDCERLVQVLANLLGNVMKFTPRGGKRIYGYNSKDTKSNSASAIWALVLAPMICPIYLIASGKSKRMCGVVLGWDCIFAR